MFKKGDYIVIKGNNFHNGYYAKIIKVQGNGADKGITYYVELLVNKTNLWLLSTQIAKPEFKFGSLLSLEGMYE